MDGRIKGREARALVAQARALQTAASGVLASADKHHSNARQAFEAARRELANEQLDRTPLARLKETTEGRVRFGPIEDAGYETVGQILKASQSQLLRLPRVGEHTVTQVLAAARQLSTTLDEATRVRFDVDLRPKSHSRLLAALRAHEQAERVIAPHLDDAQEVVGHLETVMDDAAKATSRFRRVFTGSQRRQQRDTALGQLANQMAAWHAAEIDTCLDRVRGDLSAIKTKGKAKELWEDYGNRPVAYNGLLVSIGGYAPDEDAAQGFVPAEIVARVNDQPLDTSFLTVSLRGYQAFGARFALVQRKAILGDEMGLGKTVEALAVLSHLHSEGRQRFLVVCPASVLANWAHEIARHSHLASHRLHGPDRAWSIKRWERDGGVGLTTYGTLPAIPEPDATADLVLLIADEAHYTKNPAAKRTKTIQRWIGHADRTLFLTGTPMENRVDEFRTLVRHLNPAVANDVCHLDGLAGSHRFRSSVAPVYLRRNQEDVLQELPPRIQTEEWVELGSHDSAAYRQAVASRNFMAMRRAAYQPGTVDGSAKLQRLVEIADEAGANGRKVVVFSYFKDVLTSVGVVLDGRVAGSITGAVPPAARQELIDAFTAQAAPAVLTCQIEAGGTGLNIQAASVVILTEPQWKPTTEEQAIARCHRMGQVRPVDVHRILAEDSVDQRMLEVLAGKSHLFDEYVRRSAVKDATPDAVDVSDLEATQQVASQAEAERRIIELERKRLGLDPDPGDPGS